eukprot:m.133804 g.133804  ORF g.133804 m.133804 type:complete len:913 (-) comp16520_c1_seq3:216-2954(-)
MSVPASCLKAAAAMAQEAAAILKEVGDVQIVVKQTPESTGVKSILKPKHRNPKNSPYQPVPANERSEHEHVHGRPASRRVQVRLPPGAQEREAARHATLTRGNRKRSGALGVTLDELRNLYGIACRHYGCDALPPITDILSGSHDLPETYNLMGVRNITHEQVLSLCEIVMQNPKLHNLSLKGVGLKNAGVERIMESVFFRKGVQYLSLADNPKVTKEGLKFVCLLASKSPVLSSLDLSGIPFTQKMAQMLRDGLLASKLQVLILQSCGLKHASLLSPIIIGVIGCNALAALSLKSNDIGPESAKFVCQLMQSESFVSSLDISTNRLLDEGALRIAGALSENRSLTTMNLSENFIRAPGIAAICEALAFNKVLTAIDLSENQIGSGDTALSIKSMLLRNKTLHSLSLFRAGITDEGAISLAEAVAESKTLQRLDMRENALTVSGFIALGRALQINTSIFKLLLDVPMGSSQVHEAFITDLYRSIQQRCAQNLERVQAKQRQYEAQMISEEPAPPAAAAAAAAVAEDDEYILVHGGEDDASPKKPSPPRTTVTAAPAAHGEDDGGDGLMGLTFAGMGSSIEAHARDDHDVSTTHEDTEAATPQSSFISETAESPAELTIPPFAQHLFGGMISPHLAERSKGGDEDVDADNNAAAGEAGEAAGATEDDLLVPGMLRRRSPRTSLSDPVGEGLVLHQVALARSENLEEAVATELKGSDDTGIFRQSTALGNGADLLNTDPLAADNNNNNSNMVAYYCGTGPDGEPQYAYMDASVAQQYQQQQQQHQQYPQQYAGYDGASGSGSSSYGWEYYQQYYGYTGGAAGTETAPVAAAAADGAAATAAVSSTEQEPPSSSKGEHAGTEAVQREEKTAEEKTAGEKTAGEKAASKDEEAEASSAKRAKAGGGLVDYGSDSDE